MARVAGEWQFSDLAPEELQEFTHLEELWQQAEEAGDWTYQNEIEKQINEFMDRMGEKYH